jgi:hypothetical protein
MQSLGCVAYEAYCSHTGWKSLISGARLPPWRELKPEIRAAWDAAAGAISFAADMGERTARANGFIAGATVYAREVGHSTMVSQNEFLKRVIASAHEFIREDHQEESAEPQVK